MQERWKGWRKDSCHIRAGRTGGEALLLGFEHDEKGAGFADDTEQYGLAGFHFFERFGKLRHASDRPSIHLCNEIAFLNAFRMGQATAFHFGDEHANSFFEFKFFRQRGR